MIVTIGYEQLKADLDTHADSLAAGLTGPVT